MYFGESTNGFRLKPSENVTFVIIFNLWRLNQIFVLGWGYTGSERNLPPTPLITYKIIIFRDAKMWNLFLTVRMPSFTTNQYHKAFWDPKRLFKLSKWAKTDFTQTPYNPTVAAIFLADSVSFFYRFFLKKVSNWSVTHTASNKTVPKVFETSPFFSPSIAHH